MSDLLQGSLEDNCLCALVWSTTASATIAMRVEPGLFSTRAYTRIAELAVEYLGKYHRPPGPHLRDLMEADLRRGEEGRFLSQVLDAMDALQANLHPEYVLEQLDRFIAIRQLSRSVEKAADSLHTGDLEAAREALSAADHTRSDIRPGVWLHETDRWLAFLDRDEEEDLFSSGVEVLDERDVRPRRGALFLIMAAAGRGKSYWLRQIAKQSMVSHRKKVLHITLENDLEETLQFYTMAFLGRSSEEIRSLRVPMFRRDELGRFTQLDFNQITPDRVEASQRHQIAEGLIPFQRRGKLLVQWFPTGILTLGQLTSYLDMLEHSEGFRPDLLVIDYVNLMYTDARNLRISLGALGQGLRGLAGARNMAVVTATQGNRSSAEAKLVTSSMVGEDWSLVATADTFCTYSQTLDERELGLARILVEKSRRSRDKWLALVSQSYGTGQFALDSVYMSKVAQSEIARHVGGDEDEAE